MWTTTDNGTGINGYQADRYCKNLTLGEYRDWRLPTIDELEKLHNAREDDYRHQILVPGQYLFAWSSTKEGSNSAWVFSFFSGGRRFATDLNNPYDEGRALCVRRSRE